MVRRNWIRNLAVLRFLLAGFESYCIAPTAWGYVKSSNQTRFFLALVLCAYNFGAVIATPMFGYLTDRLGNPRLFYIGSCVVKVVAYVMYSINMNEYFPLFGRLLSGLSDVGIGVLLGQIVLQSSEENSGKSFVLLEGAYCLGCALGPGVGSFITFRFNLLGWEINDGNSPGIVLTVIWLLFLILSASLPTDIWVETGGRRVKIKRNSNSSDDETSKRLSNGNQQHRAAELFPKSNSGATMFDSRIICLIFLMFCSDAYSSTSTFYVPILALEHFHLHLIHTKLLFLNCTLFTVVVFICLFLASQYIEERKLLVLALSLEIIAISFLTYLAFAWDEVASAQYYILLLYICFGMPYFMYPFGNSLLSKLTDPRYATFVQGLSLATVHSAIVISRVVVSFVFTKTSLLYYCFGMIFLWLAGVVWYIILFKEMVPNR
jgi:MFS family permease